MGYLKLNAGILLLTFFSSFTYGQNTKLNIDKHLSDIVKITSLTEADIINYQITDSYISKHNQVQHIYLEQTINGIAIEATQINLSIKNAKLVHFGNRFLDNLNQYQVVGENNIDHAAILNSAAKILEVSFQNDITNVSKTGIETTLNAYSLSHDETIKIRDQYVRDGKKLILAKEIDVYSQERNEWWQLRLNAEDGSLLGKNTWTLECNFNHGHNHNFKTNECVGAAKCKHKKSSSNASSANGYEVYAMPLMDPNYGGRTIENAPWTAATNASPFGWHDTDGVAGAEFTITRGNNVYASEDRNDTNNPGYSPDGTSSLDFLFPIDLTMDPITYQDAAITNLFYWNNIIHDVMYQYGFDEASGNFQDNNYGNGGMDSDYVNADAQDGSGTNNANMSTPPDGSNPRMQMFEWLIALPITFDVNSPASVAGPYTVAGASFGPSTGTVTGDLVLADPLDGCQSLTNGTAISGNIAVIDRGDCTFVTKVLEAQNNGAVAAIICNNQSNGVINMGGSNGSITIPSVMMSMADCDLIKMNIPTVNVTMTLSGTQIFDSDLDNGVITHEYGHGISIRLTGGPSNSSCLSGEEQMGEGWSDWWGLMLSTTSSNMGPDVRGVGAYLQGQGTNGNGIREYPYSTDLAINPHTYDDTKNVSIPHGVGSVWCAMLWDMTWNLIDEHGFDADIYNGTGGNNIAMQLIMDGLKLQPCSPGFVDGRDAILSADTILNGGANACLIWEAFSKRGLGFSAAQGTSGLVSDNVEAFDMPLACSDTLIVTKEGPAVIVDDQNLLYSIEVANFKGSAVTNLVMTDILPAGLTYVNGSLTYGTHNNGTITFTEATMADGATISTEFEVISDNSLSSEVSFYEDFELLNLTWSVSTGQGSDPFATSPTNVHRGNKCMFVPNVGAQNTQFLTSNAMLLPANPYFSIWHNYDTEADWDGGYIELSTDSGNSWNSIENQFVINGYNSFLGNGSNDDIDGKAAFSGNSNGYIRSLIDLTDYANQNVMLRLVFGSDDNTNSVGWYVDEFVLYDGMVADNSACATTTEGDNVCDTISTFFIPACEAFNRYYADTDSDGYGDDDNQLIACSIAPGYTTVNGDCDDTDSGTYPGNQGDICDGLDNDCDGDIDENCTGMLICDDVVIYVGNISQYFYHAQNELNSDALINATQTIEFTAGNVITLEDGFETTLGAEFEARIENCNLVPFKPDEDDQK